MRGGGGEDMDGKYIKKDNPDIFVWKHEHLLLHRANSCHLLVLRNTRQSEHNSSYRLFPLCQIKGPLINVLSLIFVVACIITPIEVATIVSNVHNKVVEVRIQHTERQKKRQI